MKYGHQEIQVLQLVTVKWYLPSLSARYISFFFFFPSSIRQEEGDIHCNWHLLFECLILMEINIAIYRALVWIVIRHLVSTRIPRARAGVPAVKPDGQRVSGKRKCSDISVWTVHQYFKVGPAGDEREYICAEKNWESSADRFFFYWNI